MTPCPGTRVGELLGQLRDTHHDHDTDAVERLTAENATLKQRLRDLSASSRTPEERLQAAGPTTASTKSASSAWKHSYSTCT